MRDRGDSRRAGFAAWRAVDLLDIELDMAFPVSCKVYALARAIAPGSTRTYGELARDLGDVNLSRAPWSRRWVRIRLRIVPCHRILAAGDKSGSFSAHGGAEQSCACWPSGACPSSLPLF